MGSSFSRTFKQLLLKDCTTYFSELYMQSLFVIDLFMIAYEVCMNFKLSISANSFIDKTVDLNFNCS